MGGFFSEFEAIRCSAQVFNQVEENASQYDQAGFLFVVYDVTKEDSFASCAKWIQGVRKGRPAVMRGWEPLIKFITMEKECRYVAVFP